jgi:hypothetical protein
MAAFSSILGTGVSNAEKLSLFIEEMNTVILVANANLR